ncbi:MAG: hypothetical protein L0Z46_00195 [Nitrospiraceae bacterium]|nr:hypothetical protein [Nitrospiraceae bacterium]
MNLEVEVTKAEFLPDELDGAMLGLGALPHVAAKGLMAIPPPTSDSEQPRSYFVVCVSWCCTIYANRSVPSL